MYDNVGTESGMKQDRLTCLTERAAVPGLAVTRAISSAAALVGAAVHLTLFTLLTVNTGVALLTLTVRGLIILARHARTMAFHARVAVVFTINVILVYINRTKTKNSIH